MSNSQKKKLAAIKHNLARDEAQAYKEDRLRDPEKYSYSVSARREKSRRSILPFLLAASLVNLDYIQKDFE